MGETDCGGNWVLFWWAGPSMLSKSLIQFLLMGRAVFPPCCLIWDQTTVEVMKIMVTSFKRPQAHTAALSAQSCIRPLPTHSFTRNSWTLTGKFGSVSCGVPAPFSWVLVHRRFVCALLKSVSPVLCKFCNQIPLASKAKFPGGSQFLCQIPRLGNLLWVLEVS